MFFTAAIILASTAVNPSASLKICALKPCGLTSCLRAQLTRPCPSATIYFCPGARSCSFGLIGSHNNNVPAFMSSHSPPIVSLCCAVVPVSGSSISLNCINFGRKAISSSATCIAGTLTRRGSGVGVGSIAGSTTVSTAGVVSITGSTAGSAVGSAGCSRFVSIASRNCACKNRYCLLPVSSSTARIPADSFFPFSLA